MEAGAAKAPADLRNQSAAGAAEGFGGRWTSPAVRMQEDWLIYTVLSTHDLFGLDCTREWRRLMEADAAHRALARRTRARALGV